MTEEGKKFVDDTEILLASMKRRRERAKRRAAGPRPKPHTEIKVSEIPKCDLCAEKGRTVPAYADAVLPGRGGSWANVCRDCFGWGCCNLGLGRGQKYILKGDK